MRILGWILIVLGSMLCLGALIQLANGELIMDGYTAGAIGINVVVLVLGLMILNHKKK
jgi:hypothetical protein